MYVIPVALNAELLARRFIMPGVYMAALSGAQFAGCGVKRSKRCFFVRCPLGQVLIVDRIAAPE